MRAFTYDLSTTNPIYIYEPITYYKKMACYLNQFKVRLSFALIIGS